MCFMKKIVVTSPKHLVLAIASRRKELEVDAISLSMSSQVSLKFLSQLENGKDSVEVKSLLKVTRSLGVDIPLLNNPKKLGTLIVNKRKDLGIDQITAASMSGISPRLLSTIERGEPNKRLNKLFSVIRGLGITFEIHIK